MSTDVVDLGFKVDTSDIDHAIKKFGLLDREFGKAEKSGGLVSRSFESVGESGKKSGGLVSRAFREASQDLDKTLRSAAESANSYGRAGRELAEMSSAANKAERSLRGTSSELDKNTKASGNLIGSFQALGTAVAGLGLASAATDAMNSYREFEKLQGMLKTATGSNEAAGKAFADLQKFASTTPYELAQAVEGFVKLKNLGLDPSISSLTSYGNTAAAMGKDLMQMIEAVADASTFEFERLKEFGIKSSQEKDKVSFTFQGVTTAVKKNAADIQQYLLGIGNAKFGTAMSDQAATLNGQVSNLKDTWSAFQVKFVQKLGLDEAAKSSVEQLGIAISSVSTWMDGALGKWNALVEQFRAGDGVFKVVRESLAAVGSALSPVLPYLGEFSAGLSAAAVAAVSLGAVVSVLGLLGAGAALINPITLAVGALAGAAVVLVSNWDDITAWWDGLWGDIKSTANDMVGWWNATTFTEKIIDINTAQAEVAQTVVTLLIDRWNESYLKELTLDVQTSALDYAEQKAAEFDAWWGSWNLQEVVADVTADALIWAWEKSQQFDAWWGSWSLSEKIASADASLVQAAWDLGQRFAGWWNSLTLKSIVPNIQMPDIAGMGAKLGAKLRAVGSDVIGGLADGMNRASSHISAAEKAANKIPLVMRSALDTHSPSKVTTAIGADTADGLAVGIDKNSSKAAKAAASAAKKVSDAYKSTMEGLQKQLMELTLGEEQARRYELSLDGITGANQNNIISIEAQVKKLEEQKKRLDETKQASEQAADSFKRMMDGLKAQTIELTQGEIAGRRFELSLQDITGANADAVISAESRLESLKKQKSLTDDLAKLTSELASADAQMAALKAGGVAAMDAEATRQSALNDLKEKGISVESALGQQYLTAKAAIEAKNKALEAEQDIQKNLQGIRDLNAEIAATKLGSAALAEANLQKDIRNKLDQLGLTQESELGKRIAETTRQLAAKNKELQIEQALRGLRTENAWLAKEITATQQGEKALKALNIQKRISEELDRQGIATGTQAAAQITSMIQQQEGLKEKLASIQELRQPISQFFGDVLSNGKDAFKNLGNYILNWLKKMVVEFATNKLMLSIGVDATGKGGLLGGIGDKITGIFGGIGKTITSAVTGLFGTGGLGGILGSIAGALGPIGLIAGAASLLKGLFKKEGNLVFSQGMQQGQQLTGQGGHAGQEHYRQTALGLIGATSGSNKIGRQEGFVPEFHKMMDAMVQLDAMIAKTIPNSIETVKTALSGLEMKGFSTAEMLKQRYVTVLQALPDELQKAMTNGKDLAAMSAEEIVAAFQYMNQVAESGLIPTLQQLGLAGNQSNESLLAFGIALSTAMGGIDKAKAALDNYYQAAYTDAERTAATQQQAKTALDAYNQSLGFSGAKYIDTIAELRAYIEAQDKNTEAGQKAIAAALGMVDALKALGGTAEEAAAKLKGQWDAFNDAAYTDAQKQQIAQNQAKKAIDAFNQSLGLTGNKTIDNIVELRAYMRTLDGSTEAGRKAQQAALGMTSAFVAFGGTAEQIKQKVAGLKEGIKGLVTNLYSSSSLTSTSSSTADSNQAALSAAQSNLDSLRSQLNSEQDRISEVNNQAKEAYQNQLDYYRTLKDAAENLRNVANGFADDARSAADVLKSAQLDYNRTLQAAKSGDVDAAKKLGDMATRLKSAVSVAYNNDGRAASAIQQIETQLRSTAGVLDGLAGNQPNDPGTITSTLLGSLESQIKAQESVVSSLQSIANSTSSATNEAKAVADRAAMAKELATKIGELGLATDKSAWDILTKNGINIKDLARDFGINVNQLDSTFVKKVAELSGLLNVNSLQMLNKLGVSVTDLAAAYGINTDRLNAGMVTKIGELASTLNVNSWQLLGKLGVTAQEIAVAYGINTDRLNAGMVTKIGELASTLNVNSWQLLSKLGVSVTDLAAAYGINTDRLNAGMVTKIGELASTLNVNSWQLLSKLGVTAQEIAAAYGLNTDKLNQNFLTKLDSLADVLRVSSVDLAAKLGVNIGQLGDLMANRLASLPNIPADIRAGLAPHLQDIRNAADPATLQRELKELQAYVNTLPPGIRAQLNAQLQGIVGNTGDTKTNTGDTKTNTGDTKKETMALRNVSSRITDLAIYTRDELTGQYITKMLQNTRALNQNAASIGKAAIPSYAVGSDYLPTDALANVHRGEMIFTAAQSNSMRDLAIYNQSVIPQIASYLSEIAANDAQAPVFIQPVYVAPVNSQRRTEGGKDELLEEVKGLRKDNAQLKKAVEDLMPYQSAIANNTRKSAAMQEKWDTDGQPEERAA